MLIQQVAAVQNRRLRQEELHGKQYLVVPMAMLTVGVHHGSNGPLFYPVEELAKTPAAWNMKPVVVYHPQGTTATAPEVARRSQVGIVMNATWDGSKLRAEAWLERERLLAVDPSILQAIENSRLVEISTGLYTDNEYAPGTWNGVPYEYVARNYRPDHLAILPTGKGACSVADGCGLLQVNQFGGETMTHYETPLLAPTMNFGPADAPGCCGGDDGPLVAPVWNYSPATDSGPASAANGPAAQQAPAAGATPADATGGRVGAETPLVAPRLY